MNLHTINGVNTISTFFESLLQTLPTAEELLKLEPAELAGHFLLSITKPEQIVPDSIVTADALAHAVERTRNDGYPVGTHNDVLFALMEAWQCLLNACLVAPIPTQIVGSRSIYHSPNYFVTRLGQSIEDYEDFKTKLLGDSQ